MKRFSLDIPQPFKKRCGFEVVRVCERERGGRGGGRGVEFAVLGKNVF